MSEADRILREMTGLFVRPTTRPKPKRRNGWRTCEGCRKPFRGRWALPYHQNPECERLAEERHPEWPKRT